MRQQTADNTFGVEDKKIGVPRLHEFMQPGNSFPQICVVSVNSIVENAFIRKST